MKVKLLKKVRKRFSIIHHPDGIISFKKHYKYNLLELVDSENTYSNVYAQIGRVPGESQWCSLIVPRLINEGWCTKKMRDTQLKSIKVWH